MKLKHEQDWTKTFEHLGSKYTVNFDFYKDGITAVNVEINQVFDLTAYDDVTDPAVLQLARKIAEAAADDIANNHYAV